MITKAAVRIHENSSGGITIYFKKDIAAHILNEFMLKKDLLAEFDDETGVITVKEL